MNPGKPMEILLVEDNPGDVRLMLEAFREARVTNTINVVEDGEDAMAYLHRQEPYASAAVPDIVLLDLNLPRKDGREVLAEIKSDPRLKRIPVVIMTTSKADEDILRTYDLHANAYVAKPVDLSRFLTVIKSIEEFWLTFVTLPPKGAAE